MTNGAMPRNVGIQLCRLMTVLAIVFSTARQATAESTFTTNTDTILDVTLLNGGQDIGVYAVAHVKTSVSLPTGSVTFHANIRQESAITYAGSASNDPRISRLKELKDLIGDIRAQIVWLQLQIYENTLEMKDVAKTDTEPFFPGLQIDEDRLNQLRNEILQWTQQLKQLQRQLSDAYDEIRDILAALKADQEPEEEIVRIEGSFNVTSPDCFNSLACEFVAPFTLVRQNSTASVVFLRFGLQFSERGELVSVVADLACGTPCGPGEEGCGCF